MGAQLFAPRRLHGYRSLHHASLSNCCRNYQWGLECGTQAPFIVRKSVHVSKQWALIPHKKLVNLQTSVNAASNNLFLKIFLKLLIFSQIGIWERTSSEQSALFGFWKASSHWGVRIYAGSRMDLWAHCSMWVGSESQGSLAAISGGPEVPLAP
jgi:hypothetical protein